MEKVQNGNLVSSKLIFHSFSAFGRHCHQSNSIAGVDIAFSSRQKGILEELDSLVQSQTWRSLDWHITQRALRSDLQVNRVSVTVACELIDA